MRCIWILHLTGLILASVQPAGAFSLLGPFEPWMSAELSYRDGNSIGGPMNLGAGYRWNIPVVNYAFDQSFLDYFGTNGVAAVESALKILNELPAASALDLAAYPDRATRVNFRAQALSLADLKSAALNALIEQLGLAQPERFTFTLRDVSVFNGATNYTVETRNFDPATLLPSGAVNGIAYTFHVIPHRVGQLSVADALELPVDPLTYGSALADGATGPGDFFTGLTRDDAGGLRYLLGTNQLAVENLLAGVHGTGPAAGNLVTTALRPGIDKLTFAPVAYDPALKHIVPPVTNQWSDRYVTNGVVQQQTVARVVTQPDLLFTAEFAGLSAVTRSGTTNWALNNLLNGDSNSGGPGVIQPPVRINFNPRGRAILSVAGIFPPKDSDFYPLPAWGSYDATTNAPITYVPGPRPDSGTTFHLLLFSPDSCQVVAMQVTWQLTGALNSQHELQCSTNLADWLPITTITHQGGHFTYAHPVASGPGARYFRTVPKAP